MNDDFSQAIREAIWCEIAGKLHTCIPATVLSYDKSGPSVTAKPLLKRLLVNGESMSMPTIVLIPVVFPRTQEFHISFPIKNGDGVLLLFSERSLETWLKDGREIAPNDSRKFHLSDAIAIPGLFGFGKGQAIDSADNLEIVFKNSKIVSDGTNFEVTGDMKITGKVTATDDVKVGTVSLKGHAHGLTGVKVPSAPYTFLPTDVTGGPQ